MASNKNGFTILFSNITFQYSAQSLIFLCFFYKILVLSVALNISQAQKIKLTDTIITENLAE